MHAVVAFWVAMGLTAHPVHVVVLDVRDTSGNQGALARQLTAIVVSEVGRAGNVDVVSNADVMQQLSLEKQRKLLGCNDEGCLTEIGNALGADYLVATSLGRIGTRWRVDLRLVHTSTARAVASVGDFVSGTEDALADSLVKMVDQLMEEGKVKLAPPPPAAGGLVSSQEASSGASRAPAYAVLGVAGALVVGAAFATYEARHTYESAVASPAMDPSSLKWKSPLADGLWVGAIAGAVVGTALFIHEGNSPAGGGAP